MHKVKIQETDVLIFVVDSMTGLVWLVVIIIILVGLLQIPLLCDLLRSCAPNYAPKRIVGPVLDTIVVCVMW